MSKLILGTAQFGSNYGIKHDGQPSIPEIEKIARVAWDAGIRVIHTSWQYGLHDSVKDVFDQFQWIVKGYSVPSVLYWDDLSLIGAAVYDEQDLKKYCLKMTSFINVPLNVLDNRWLNIKHGYKIHARSVFLQGLLLMELVDLPKWIDVNGVAFYQIERFHRACKLRDLQPYEAALGWVLGLDEIDKIIVGVNSEKQLEQLVKVKPLKWDYDFSINDEMVLDPRRWPRETKQARLNTIRVDPEYSLQDEMILNPRRWPRV